MPASCSTPPRAPPIQYSAPHGTRWDKEKAAAGGAAAFDLPSDPGHIGPWILGECVGKGASGRVKIAQHRHTGQLAAVKILPLAPLVNSRASLATQQAKSDKQRLGIDREITMMKLMNHPNIMRIYDVYEGANELFLVLEYVEGGELFDLLVNKGRLPPDEALEYFKQIIYGLNYAHTFSIIHRDLKPENILIASLSPPVIKIADWGMAAFAPPSLQLETSCGSPHYASPEIVNGKRYEGNATDIWSCGVVLYALLSGRLPFDDKDVKILLEKVKSGKYEMPPWIDPIPRDLLQRMLVVDVTKRITIPEILSHQWLLTPKSQSHTDTTHPPHTATPPLPPSPSTLARPLPSPHHIDPALLASLRVIWGRHADPAGQNIIADLCAPAGRGVHAKAFYFLLGRYRDDSVENNKLRDDPTQKHKHHDDSTPKHKDKLRDDLKHKQCDESRYQDRDIGTTFNIGWDTDLGPRVVPTKYDTTHYMQNQIQHRGRTLEVPQRSIRKPLHPAPRATSPSPRSQNRNQGISGLAPPIMTRASTNASRSRSPAGPRVPMDPARPRTQMDPVGPRAPVDPPRHRHYGMQAQGARPNLNLGCTQGVRPDLGVDVGMAGSSGTGTGVGKVGGRERGPRPAPPRRGYTYSHPVPQPGGGGVGGGGVSSVRFPVEQHVTVQDLQRDASTQRSPGASTPDWQRVSLRSDWEHAPSWEPATARGSGRPRSACAVRVGSGDVRRRERMGRSVYCDRVESDVGDGDREVRVIHAPRPVVAVPGDARVMHVPRPVVGGMGPPASPRVGCGESEVQGGGVGREKLRQEPIVGGGGNAQARRVFSRVGEDDKENRNVGWNDAGHGVDRDVGGDEGEKKGGVGLGVGMGIGREIGNVHIGDVAGGGKGRKEREKGRPPTMDFPPLNVKRSTMSVLGSPIVLSGPSHPTQDTDNSHATNRLLTSPVVGEFKGWFSNLFSWKHNSGTGVLYSPDDAATTRRNVGRLLEGLGVIVEGWGFSAGTGVGMEGGKGRGEGVLRCRVGEVGTGVLSGLELKPVRFRIEFSAALKNGDSLAATSNLLASPKASAIARGRASTLMAGRSAGISQAMSAYPIINSGACACAIVMVQEKGSVTTFRAVWRRLKEVYGDESGGERSGYPCLSPMMGSTPLMEHGQRFGV